MAELSNQKSISIQYLKKWKVSDDGIKTPVYGHKTVSNSHYRRYYNTLCFLAGLGGCTRNLMDYICERMDAVNKFSSNQGFRKAFRKDIADWTKGEVIYTDSAVKKAMHNLIDKGLLLKGEKRGSLQVNPELFFKGDDRDRVQAIKMILTFDE